VGTSGDSVAIYRGIPQSLGPISLHHVVESSSLSVDALAPFQRERVDASIRTDSLSEARGIVTDLEGSG
jgi:protein phosphatase